MKRHLLASAFPVLRRKRTFAMCGSEIKNPHVFVPQEGDLRGVSVEDLARSVNCRRCLKAWEKSEPATRAKLSYMAAVAEAQESRVEGIEGE